MAAPEWVQLQSSITPKTKEDSSSKRIRDLKRRHKEAIRFAYQKGFLRRLDYDFLYEHTFGRKVPKDDGSEEDEDFIAPDLNMGELLWLNIGSKHIRTIDETIIFSCEKLRICILSSNYVSDITPFHSCVNLVKLDLRDNQVHGVYVALMLNDLFIFRSTGCQTSSFGLPLKNYASCTFMGTPSIARIV